MSAKWAKYVPSQSLAKFMLLWRLFSIWQPYLCFWRCHLCRLALSTLLTPETSYFMYICTYAPSQSLAKIMLLWSLFSNWQPYLWFSFNLSSGYTVNDTVFIFGRLMHLYTLLMCTRYGIDAIYIFSLAAIFVFFLRSDISNLILFRHFANEHCSMYCLSFMILPNELRSLWTYLIGPEGPELIWQYHKTKTIHATMLIGKVSK